MAEIEIGPLTERLSDEEIVELCGGLEKLGAPQLPKAADDSLTPVGDLDDDALTDFMERLEPHDACCEIYLPVEFDGRIEVGSMRVGSAAVLLEVLEEMKDELSIDDGDEDEEEEDEEDDEDEDELILAKLRFVWKVLYDGAQGAIERHQPLLLHS